MEFLFVNQAASIEAMIVFACMLIIVWIFWYDGVLYLRRVFSVLFPRRNKQTQESSSQEIESPLPQISPFAESIEQKAPEEDLTQYTSIDGVILENPVLYPEDSSGETQIPDSLPDIALEENTTWDEAVEIPLEIDDTSYIGSSPISDDTHLEADKDAWSEVKSTPTTIEEPHSDAEKSWEEPESKNQDKNDEKSSKREVKENMGEVLRRWRHETKHEPVVPHAKPHKKSHIKPEKRERLVEILNNVKTLIARGQIDDARALIVSGLAIDKDNRELNLLMASLYERDHAFAKAEFILKDIATENPDDIEVLTHLATDLAMQRKYDVSYELYKKILSLGGETEENLYTLTHLASEMNLPEDVITYARNYLKQYPHNPEILWVYTQSLITVWQRKEAVETLIKLKNLTPYNQEIADLIQKLVTEEELAGNFGGEKS